MFYVERGLKKTETSSIANRNYILWLWTVQGRVGEGGGGCPWGSKANILRQTLLYRYTWSCWHNMVTLNIFTQIFPVFNDFSFKTSFKYIETHFDLKSEYAHKIWNMAPSFQNKMLGCYYFQHFITQIIHRKIWYDK